MIDMKCKLNKMLVLITLMVFTFAGCSWLNVQSNNNSVSPIPTEKKETGDDVTQTPSPAATIAPIEAVIETTATPIVEHTQSIETQPYRTYTVNEIDDIKKVKREDIAQPLIDEYFYWMHQLDNETNPKNFVRALIYKELAGEFLFDRETNNNENYTNWEEETPNAYNYIRNVCHFTPVPARITFDSIKIISIVQPIGDEYGGYYEIMNEIRGTPDEAEFLKGLNDLGYYAVDIYVEDLLELDRRIPCNGIKLYDKHAVSLDEIYDNITQMPENKELKQYLDKYDRQINFSNELKNKEWNLFLFNRQEKQPAIIEVHIRTYETKGGIGLRQKVS